MTHNPRKRFGQNFLVDDYIIDSILDAINPKPDQHILEIGPGLGALTSHLVASGANITAIEIDRDLSLILLNKFSSCKNFQLQNIDILKYSIPLDNTLRVIGNLPYNISTPILFKMFADISHIQDMFFMLQLEVGKRLIATPNSKEYGRLSVMAQYFCDIEIILNVPKTAFDPQPKVESCIIHFTPKHNTTDEVIDSKMFYNIVTSAFNHRRKTISNSLKDFLSASELESLNIAPNLRAENLKLDDYIRISNFLSKD